MSNQNKALNYDFGQVHMMDQTKVTTHIVMCARVFREEELKQRFEHVHHRQYRAHMPVHMTDQTLSDRSCWK